MKGSKGGRGKRGIKQKKMYVILKCNLNLKTKTLLEERISKF